MGISANPDLIGTSPLSQEGDFVAGSSQCFVLTYQCDLYGIDDLGMLLTAFRSANDQTILQTTDLAAAGYISADASKGALFDIFNRRHYYATTGAQIWLSVSAAFGEQAVIYGTNPEYGPANSAAALKFSTTTVGFDIDISDIGMPDTVFGDGGIEKRVWLFRLPDKNDCTHFGFSKKIDVCERGNTRPYVCTTQEDGHRAWSSPLYIFRARADLSGLTSSSASTFEGSLGQGS